MKKLKSERAMNHGTSEKEWAYWGKGKFANMPTDVVQKQYPMKGYGLPEDIDDTMVRIDDDSEDSSGIVRRQKHKSMY